MTKMTELDRATEVARIARHAILDLTKQTREAGLDVADCVLAAETVLVSVAAAAVMASIGPNKQELGRLTMRAIKHHLDRRMTELIKDLIGEEEP